MSFNSHNLERLRNIRRQLPQQQLSSNTSSRSNKEIKTPLHPIETEENPEQLFRELINASSDGDIPSHLIDRLKNIESLHLQKKATLKNNNHSDPTREPNDLYISFQSLLLEEEEELS